MGRFPSGASPYGCLDMAGNVGQWCEDYYDGSFFNASIVNNPVNLKKSGVRVLRGGSWDGGSSEFFRSSYRVYDFPSSRGYDVGFRCVSGP